MPTVLFSLGRGGGQTPVIGKIDGDYQFDSRKTTLIWSLPVIDQSNSEGSLEFSVKGKSADFFPIQVDFVAETPFCDIKVNEQLFFYLISVCNSIFYRFSM